MGFISSWFGVHRAILHSWGASVFISFCDSVPGDSLVFHQENQGSLRVWLGIPDCSAWNAGESSLISQRGGCLIRFLELQQNLGYICELQRGWPFETPLCSAKSGLLCSYEGHLRNLNLAWQGNTVTSGCEVGDQVSLSSFHRDIGIPINFQEESRLFNFWSLELHEPLEVSRDVRPPVHLTRGTRVSSRISTHDSDIRSSCQMKDEPAFKPLQENPTLFLVRESQYPLHLRQKTQGPSHIAIAEGRLLLSAYLKLDYLFNRILGISSLLETIWYAWSFPRVPVLKLVFL